MKIQLIALLAATLIPALSQEAFKPEPIMPGGEIIPLYPPDSPFLNKTRISEPEKYNSTFDKKPDHIVNVLNVHNPSIEVHLVPDDAKNTGTFIILAPGGGHKILGVAAEGAAWVSHFSKMGISTAILRNRLRVDGYEPTTDATYDAQQAIRIVRANAAKWKTNPKKIGIIGFSAGAELVTCAALSFGEFEKNNSSSKDPLAGISARPDFIGVIYPGPSPFARETNTKIPANVPPSFTTCSGVTDKVHAVWANEWFSAMLNAGVPNSEIHIYARGSHGGAKRGPEEIPFASWPDRFTQWLGDLGFLEKSDEETRAAKDSEAFAKTQN